MSPIDSNVVAKEDNKQVILIHMFIIAIIACRLHILNDYIAKMTLPNQITILWDHVK